MTAKDLARHIVVTLRDKGHVAYWAGGCVRDLLLGVEPQDYDVATDALAVEIQSYFPRSNAVGAQFGVVLVPWDEAQVEVATFRLDHDYRDGRRPSSVSFTRSAEQDVQRRDFTINGLLFDPLEDRYLDFVGGRRDLEARLIRAIGSAAERFAEDKLRMLRAVRLAARLDFAIESETLAAIRGHAPEVLQIAPERIRDELNRILTEGRARRGFELLDETGLLNAILPEVARMKGVAQPPEFHPEGDVWTHTLLMLEQLENPTVTLALGTLLHDVGKPPTYRVAGRIRFDGHVEAGVEIARGICERLRYSNTETEQVVALVANHMRFREVTRMRTSTLKRFMRLPGFEEHLELHRLDCLGSHRDLGNYEFLRRMESELDEKDLRPPRLITGDDLIAAGYEPGPPFQAILAAVENAQLEGQLNSREEALAFVERRFEKPAGRGRQGDQAGVGQTG
jgi:poly(A) polymerase